MPLSVSPLPGYVSGKNTRTKAQQQDIDSNNKTQRSTSKGRLNDTWGSYYKDWASGDHSLAMRNKVRPDNAQQTYADDAIRGMKEAAGLGKALLLFGSRVGLVASEISGGSFYRHPIDYSTYYSKTRNMQWGSMTDEQKSGYTTRLNLKRR